MNKLITFSLFGQDSIYQSGAIRNAILAKAIYPEWTCRFYVSQEIPRGVLKKLEHEGAEIVPMVRKSYFDGTFWRFLPASEKGLTVLIVRDVDSRLNAREAAAVSEWLDSDKQFHIMRDHPLHYAPILGGMWGVKGGVIGSMKFQINKWRFKRYLNGKISFHEKGLDQVFLCEEIYPRIKATAFIHSDFIRFDDEDISPFPTSRINGEFVGQIYTEKDDPILPLSEKDCGPIRNLRIENSPFVQKSKDFKELPLKALRTAYHHFLESIRLRIFEERLKLTFIHSCMEDSNTTFVPATQTTNYVISKRSTGLGDCLISLISAWSYAKATGRALVIDWRFSCYLQDPQSNLFPLLFHPVSEIDGVPIICDQSISSRQFLGPFFPPEWSANAIHKHLLDRNQFLTKTMVRRLNSKRDIPAESIVIHGCMYDARPSDDECRAFLSHLIPVPEVAQQIQQFRRRHFGPNPVIGIHIRHGNGGNIMGHTPYWKGPDDALNRCVRQIQAILDTLGDNSVIFLCTDSQEVEISIKSKISQVVTREKQFRRPGEGELHLGNLGLHTAQDALIEMLLLSYSTILIKYPPKSFFSFYAYLFHQRPKPHLDMQMKDSYHRMLNAGRVE